MSHKGRITISPALLGVVVAAVGVIVTIAIAFSAASVSYGVLKGRIDAIENKTDFKELREEQNKITKTIQQEILDAEKKLSSLKQELNTHQDSISSNFEIEELKFSNNITTKLESVKKEINDKYINISNSIDNIEKHLTKTISDSNEKKEEILRDLNSGIDSELARTNKLTLALKNRVDKYNNELSKNQSVLSKLKIRKAEIKNELEMIAQSIEDPSITQETQETQETQDNTKLASSSIEYDTVIRNQPFHIASTSFAGRNKRVFSKNNKEGTYIGDIENELPHGCGSYENKTTYVGQYNKGIRHGYGIEERGRNIRIVKYIQGVRKFTLTRLRKFKIAKGVHYYGVNGKKYTVEIGFIKTNNSMFLNQYKDGKLMKTICSFDRAFKSNK